MIVLPDRHVPRARFLMPVPISDWRTPSQAQQKSQFGHENHTTFCISAYRGRKLAWRGRFEDRDDVDAFLWAIATGLLKYQRELWRLPSPEWHPGIGEGLTYEMVTNVKLTSTSASVQTYTIPADWGSVSNQIQCIGSGCGGAGAVGTFGGGGGGGGGAWVNVVNVAMTPGGTTGFRLDVGGVSTSTTSTSTGSLGATTYFRIDGGTTTPTTIAQGAAAEGAGQGGAATGVVGTGVGATGGRLANSVGAGTKYSGGNGGAGIAAAAGAGGGGGGAAGPSGSGGTGNAATSTWGAGGIGDAANGGAGGGAAGLPGSAGAEIFAATGSGGGGAGNASSGSCSGGGAGNYGGGGGGAGVGAASGTAVGGAGGQGLIFITYTPASGDLQNMPMMGF